MKIFCIHQGYELYGSDRMFINSLEAFRQEYKDSYITVHLPKKGQLYDYLINHKLADNIIVKPLGVLRKSDIKSLKFGNLIKELFNLPGKIKTCNEYDIIYINSIVVLDYLLASRFLKCKAKIIHIHEIPGGFIKSIFQALIRFSKCTPIYISKAVETCFTGLKKGHLVYNGIEAIGMNQKSLRPKLRILMIGRINSWKGQDLLLESVSYMSKKYKDKIEIRIVGSVFENQIHFKENLENIVNKNGLENIVSFINFIDNPNMEYCESDVIVIPSKSPEPFGLVAIEAASCGKVVLAANHGGLAEIFEDGVNGLYFEPNNKEALYKQLINILDMESKEIQNIGNEAAKLFKDKFTSDSYKENFIIAIQKEL